MYKGKFDQKNRGSSVSVEEIVAQRNAAPKRKRPAPPMEEPEILRKGPAAEPVPEKIAVRVHSKGSGKEPEILTPKKYPAPDPIPVTEVIPPKPQPAPRAPEKKKKGPRLGGVIFYTFYFMFILLFFVGVFLGLQWLKGWLVDYEKAQPTVKAQQVYDQVFADPDWAALYNAAGVEDSKFVGIDEFVAHMENKVGSTKLTYQETSAGLSGGKKYLVYLGDEKVASFTLTGGENVTSITDIPDWKLGSVELFFERNGSVRVQKVNGHTVQVNGVELDDSYTIQIATTKAEEYLPAGTSGVFTCIQEVTGLMGTPEIAIYDEKGNQMEVIYDEEKDLYVEQTETNTMTEDQKELALDAVETYSLWMLAKITDRAKIAKYFDPSSDTYDSIYGMLGKLHVQDFSKYEFVNQSVTDYCRYSDKLYSVHVKLTLNVTRTNGTIKEFPVDCSLFFHQKDNGKWLVYEMTMEDVSEPVGKVRLTFKDGDTVLYSDFVKTDASSLTTPMISVPVGKVFSGWARESVDEDGNTTWTIMFTPDENGHVSLPSGNSLEPMTLFAVFENAPAENTETETEGA